MEKVKFLSNEYELVANGVRLTPEGGKVILQPGTYNFYDVESDIKVAKTITVLDSMGEPLETHTGLVYAGRLAKDDNYVVGTIQTENGTDSETGEPTYSTENVIGTVLIAEFRKPDIREDLKKLAAQVEYITMMTGTEMEV